MSNTVRTAKSASNDASRKIIKALLLLSMVLFYGTFGYMTIEGWHFLDAIYMTIITITTVGYGEIRAVSETGRVFTISLIVVGMGIMAYTLGMVAQAMVELQLRTIMGRRKLGMKIRSMKGHYIICGYGRIGRIIAQELKKKGIPLIVIDHNPETRPHLEQNDIPYIIDDATSEDVLQEAGIERAKGLVAVVLSDADNLFLTMTARGLNPGLFILARADSETNQRKLLRAGANRVAMPYRIGGQRMAHTITKPAVMDFLEFTVQDQNIDLKMEQLQVNEQSRLNGVNLLDSGIRQKLNIIIVAISKKDGTMLFNPSSQARIEAGDTLIALGHGDDLEKLERILAGG